MSLDLDNDYKEINETISSYKTTVELKKSEVESKLNNAADSLGRKKSDALKQLNDLGDVAQRAQNKVKNQFDQIFELVKSTMPSKPGSDSPTVTLILKQLLNAVQSTKNRISEILVDEIVSTAGCSQEQTFNTNESIYINVNSIDFFNLLKNSYEDKPYNLLYEKQPAIPGVYPYSMDRSLYDLTQSGQPLIIPGISSNPLFEIQYVTQNSDGQFGDFYKVDLKNRPNGNNISDFINEYYKTINVFNLDVVLVRIMDAINNVVKIQSNISVDEIEDQSKFSKIIQRILGLCFDSRTEIDVSGNAKSSVLDNIDDSFFEFTSADLKSINEEVNNVINKVVEFEDCGNIKFPSNPELNQQILEDLIQFNGSDKIDEFIKRAEESTQNDEWKKLGLGLDLKLSIKLDIIKKIIESVTFAILSPKAILGLMIVLKALSNNIGDSVENVQDFIKTFKKFVTNFISKIGAIFIEELVLLLKKNLRLLVETLLTEIVLEAKDARLKAISGILFVLIQVTQAILDYRSCKSVVDEIQKLLNLSKSLLGNRMPTFALASAGLLGGFSPTRAMAGVIGQLDKLGLPTGPLPDGSPNLGIQAMSGQIKAVNNEDLANSKVEVFIPPLAVAALGGGTTLPGRGVGKKL